MRTGTILDPLLPHSRQAVLATLLIQPDRRWYLSDLAHHLHVQPSSLQRELASLTEGGILHREPDGNRVYYRANTAYPLFPELRSIFIKTTGLADHIRAVLNPFFDRIEFSFIYGSVARGERTANSDADIMVIGSVGLSDLATPLRELERTLAIPVNVAVYSTQEFVTKWKQENHFLRTILREPKIFLKGSDDELAIAVGGSENQSTYDEQTRA
jgi:predicted nucleotidyltransferase